MTTRTDAPLSPRVWRVSDLNRRVRGLLDADAGDVQILGLDWRAHERELRQRLGDRHPEVVQLQASIGNLRARVQAETRRVVGSLTVNDSVNQARLTGVREALEQQRAKLLRLKGERDEAAVLQRDVENAQNRLAGRALVAGRARARSARSHCRPRRARASR